MSSKLVSNFNNKAINWTELDCTPINFNAFISQQVIPSNNASNSARVLLHNHKEDIINVINLKNDTDEKKKLVLYKVLLDPEMVHISKSVLMSIFQSYNWQLQFSEKNELIPMSVSDDDDGTVTTNGDSIVDTMPKTKSIQSPPKSINYRKYELLEHMNNNIRSMIQIIYNSQGRIQRDKEKFLQTLYTSMYDTGLQKRFSKKEIGVLLGISRKTVLKRFKQASQLRHKIDIEDPQQFCLEIKNQRKSSISDDLKQSVLQFVENHDKVKISPVMHDTLKIKGVVVYKKIRMISIHELHNDLRDSGIPNIVKSDNKLAIGYESLRLLLKFFMPNLRRATNRHMQMCGCEICITAARFQYDFNIWRSQMVKLLKKDWNVTEQSLVQAINHGLGDSFPSHLKRLQERCEQKKQLYYSFKNFAFPNDSPRHQKPSEALKELMCAFETCGNFETPNWTCVLGQCTCCPKYVTHPIEQNTSLAPKWQIEYQHYIPFTRCNVHDLISRNSKVCPKCEEEKREAERRGLKKKKSKIFTKKVRIKSICSIGSFINDVYLPFFNERFRYHYNHMKILSRPQVIAERIQHFAEDRSVILMQRDFAEAIKGVMNEEIQSEHFGAVPQLVLEGATCSYYCPSKNDNHKVFFSHFSDDAKQCAATSYENMRVQLETLKDRNILKPNTVIYDHTDGCTNQYRSATAIYLLSVLSSFFKVSIDRLVNAPAHGKNEVDGLSAITKMFLLQCMFRTASTTTSDIKNMFQPWLYCNGTKNSLAEQAVRLCNQNDRKDGVVSDGDKYAKREEERKVHERLYFSLQRSEVTKEMFSVKTICCEKTKKEEHGGIMARYNIRTDPDLGIGKAAVRRVPCACLSCRKQLQASWKPNVPADQQERYAQNRDCIRWNALKETNDWEIITLKVNKKKCPEEVLEDIGNYILDDSAMITSLTVSVGAYCAISASEPDIDYHILKYTSPSYAFCKKKYKGDKTLIEEVHEGDLVAEGLVMDNLGKNTKWLLPSKKKEKMLIRLKKVVRSPMRLEKISKENQLPGSYEKYPFENNKGRISKTMMENRKKLIHAVRIEQIDIDMIMDEVKRRECYDFTEKMGCTVDSDDEDDSDSDDDDDDYDVHDRPDNVHCFF